jgi:hypothetical protein
MGVSPEETGSTLNESLYNKAEALLNFTPTSWKWLRFFLITDYR